MTAINSNTPYDITHLINQMECRVCLTELDANSTFCNVFSSCDDLPWKDKTYSQLILSCADTQINDGDPFPKFICDVCIMDLYTAYNFKLQCELSYKSLLENEQLYKNLFENKQSCTNFLQDKQTYKHLSEKTEYLSCESNNEFEDRNSSDEESLESNPNFKVETIKKVNKRGFIMIKNRPLKKRRKRLRVDKTLKEDTNTAGNEHETTEVSEITLEKYHIKNGKFICNMCDKVCHNKRYVQYHLMLHDKSRTQYKCSYPNCDRVFLSNGGIGKHLLIHQGKKNFICEQCGKAFYINAHLQAHVNLTHLKIKNYKCDFCPKRYESKYKKIQHMNTHVNERPFKCDICEKRFFKLAALNFHFRVHNKKDK